MLLIVEKDYSASRLKSEGPTDGETIQMDKCKDLSVLCNIEFIRISVQNKNKRF